MKTCTRARKQRHRPPGSKTWGLTEDVKMASGRVFDHENVCYRSWELKNNDTGHWGRKYGGWTEDVKMTFGRIFGYENVCYMSREPKNSDAGHRCRTHG